MKWWGSVLALLECYDMIPNEMHYIYIYLVGDVMSIVWHHQKDVKLHCGKKPSSTTWSPKKAGAKPIFLCCFFHWNTALTKSRPSQIGVPWNLGELSTCPKCQEPRSVTGLKLIGEEAPETLWMLIDWKVRFWEGKVVGRLWRIHWDGMGCWGFSSPEMELLVHCGRFFRVGT